MSLLDRTPDQVYLNQCREVLALVPETPPPTISYLLFTLAGQSFGLEAACAGQVLGELPLRSVPNRSREILLGLVNWEGSLLPCVSLLSLLTPESGSHILPYQSLVLDLEGERYVTRVGRVKGIVRLPSQLIEPAPQASRYLTGIASWEGEKIGLLDSPTLRHGLRRGLAR